MFFHRKYSMRLLFSIPVLFVIGLYVFLFYLYHKTCIFEYYSDTFSMVSVLVFYITFFLSIYAYLKTVISTKMNANNPTKININNPTKININKMNS